jgi:hypothetical protein
MDYGVSQLQSSYGRHVASRSKGNRVIVSINQHALILKWTYTVSNEGYVQITVLRGRKSMIISEIDHMN